MAFFLISDDLWTWNFHGNVSQDLGGEQGRCPRSVFNRNGQVVVGSVVECLLGSGFKYFCMFTPTWGNDPI